jgi:hypothetical protein
VYSKSKMYILYYSPCISDLFYNPNSVLFSMYIQYYSPIQIQYYSPCISDSSKTPQEGRSIIKHSSRRKCIIANNIFRSSLIEDQNPNVPVQEIIITVGFIRDVYSRAVSFRQYYHFTFKTIIFSNAQRQSLYLH